ncbi:MAG TPA: peroxiredoxin [Gammaproteobacteria bacterium]|nr:peroxiredoxin [Gammaproteobacteria bacterium]
MEKQQLREIQAPLKTKYIDDPGSASVTLRATGDLGKGIACKVKTGSGLAEAGLHPASGGDGTQLCSGDMLLEALVACAGVTLGAVSTALGISLRDAKVSAEGDLDFRGTLAITNEAPVGLNNIRLTFTLDTDASKESLDKLIELTERYCVVLQTIKHPPHIAVTSELRFKQEV